MECRICPTAFHNQCVSWVTLEMALQMWDLLELFISWAVLWLDAWYNFMSIAEFVLAYCLSKIRCSFFLGLNDFQCKPTVVKSFHSTETAMARVVCDVLTIANNKLPTMLLSLEISEVFYTLALTTITLFYTSMNFSVSMAWSWTGCIHIFQGESSLSQWVAANLHLSSSQLAFHRVGSWTTHIFLIHNTNWEPDIKFWHLISSVCHPQVAILIGSRRAVFMYWQGDRVADLEQLASECQ